VPELVAVGCLRTVGDDHVVGQLAAVLLADRLHLAAHGLGREAGVEPVDRARGRGPSPRRRPSARA
jgi:hypothetical protein